MTEQNTESDFEPTEQLSEQVQNESGTEENDTFSITTFLFISIIAIMVIVFLILIKKRKKEK